MKKITYSQIQETYYYEKMDNGLEVILIPKEGFHKTYALFSTKFGSIDNEFVPRGKKESVKMPDGIAHFLEHKMFDKKEGDVFQLFGREGASANAFTSFTRTAYLFSTTNQLDNNLHTLLDFVQDPYFTEEKVEKEKGIIGQEIQMYDDNPDWRVFFGLLENLYPDQPVHIDIAGTVESIDAITAEMLYENHATFYHPSNMQLIVAGKLDPEHVMDEIRQNQQAKSFSAPTDIQRIYPENDLSMIVPHRTEHLAVSRPKVLVGVRGAEVDLADARTIQKRYELDMLLKLLFGPTSSNYLDLYDAGLVDDSFSYEYSYETHFDFVAVGGDTKKPDELEVALKRILLEASTSPELTESHFKMVKKRTIGQLLQALNSPEYMATQFVDFYYEDATLFDLIPIVEAITLADIRKAAANFFKEERMSVFRILPLGEQKSIVETKPTQEETQ